MFATPSYFFFSSVLGFEPLQGDSLWRIAPAVVGATDELTWAGGSVWTVKGQLQSIWKLHMAKPWSLSMNLSIPLGLRALVVVPVANKGSPTTSQCTISETKDVVWRDRKFVGGAPGVVTATETHTKDRGAAVAVTLEGGQYNLQMICSE
jgi:hypothetical protein|eukprot:COSAG02_NODE_8491_length_2551_cov_2.682300_4_plen_150_part_00